MKNIRTIVIIAMLSMICCPLAGHSDDYSLTFSTVRAEIKASDLPNRVHALNNKHANIFAKDNLVYIVNDTIVMDGNDLACGAMLNTSFSRDSLSVSSQNMFRVNIQFNSLGKNKLRKLSRSSIGHKLAIMFHGRLIVAPVIMGQINDGVLCTNGLSYDDATRLIYVLHKACSSASNVSFNLVNGNCADQKQLQANSLRKYTCLSMGREKYFVSKKTELDSTGFESAQIMCAVKAAFTNYKVRDVRLKDIPWRISEEEEAAHNGHIFGVKIVLNKKGRNILKKLSMNNSGQELATMFEGNVHYVQRIHGKAAPDSILVNNLTYIEARRLAYAINHNETRKKQENGK